MLTTVSAVQSSPICLGHQDSKGLDSGGSAGMHLSSGWGSQGSQLVCQAA